MPLGALAPRKPQTLPLQAEPKKDGADKRVVIVGSITGNTNTLAGNVPPKVLRAPCSEAPDGTASPAVLQAAGGGCVARSTASPAGRAAVGSWDHTALQALLSGAGSCTAAHAL
jgi:hypothetical protein